MDKLTDNQILEIVHKNPELANIVLKYEELRDEGRLLILPVKFGTTLYGVDRTDNTKNGAQGYYRVRHFVFGHGHLDKLPKIGKEFFETEEDALKYKKRLETQLKKDEQKSNRENVSVADIVYSEYYGWGNVKDISTIENKTTITISFPEKKTDVKYDFNDFVNINLTVIPKTQLNPNGEKK